MSRRPLIGITGAPHNREWVPGCDLPFNELTVGYSNGVFNAGGRPVIIPVVPEPLGADFLDGIDGLIFTGGADVNPELYGEEPDSSVYGVNSQRDAQEIALLEEAEHRGIPVLAICRGLQILNVSRGGSLIQDIDGHWQSNMEPWEFLHEVDVVPGSYLHEVVKTDKVRVNSFHHQAIKEVGEGLTVVARDGGIIEAVETEDHRVLAVQWHPEHLHQISGENKALFEDLVLRAKVASPVNR